MQYKILLLIMFVIFYVQANDTKSLIVDIYPGFGWDNLRFMDMNPIFDVSNFNYLDKFQSCIEVIPVRRNRIELSSTLIDMFDARTSDYSSNLFIGGSGSYKGFKAGGSYSSEYQTTKKQQGEEKTISFRNQIDYIMYDVILKSSCQLSSQVKKDLIEIAEYQTSNQSIMATYAAQLFVRTYGTHLTNRLSLGGSIIEEDFIKESIYREETMNRATYRQAAEASFLGTFGVSANFASSSTTNNTSINEAKKKFTRKVINSKGGKLSLGAGSIESWQSSIDSTPVIVRRAIENITFLIQSDKIPELSKVQLLHVLEKIQEAIDTYIEMNVYSGCMDRNSTSFNWIVNVDDGSCAPAEKNLQFGGFIRTCTEDSRLNSKCKNYRILNYYTQTEECPPNFVKYLLHESTQTENIFQRKCRRCTFFKVHKCCEDILVGVGERKLNFYGCNSNKLQLKSSTGVLKIANNYVYGGSFTSKKINPITGTTMCPSGQFKEIVVINDITVCLTERISDTDDLPHYGGIYSCNQGNIALNPSEKGCSVGYSAHVMGAIEGNCLLFVCLKFKDFREDRQMPPIALPPFFSIPLTDQTRMHINDTEFNGTYATVTTTEPSILNSENIQLGLSIVGISIGILAVVIATFLAIQNRRQRRKLKNSNGGNYEHL